MDKNPDLTLLNSTKTPQNLALTARSRQLTAPEFFSKAERSRLKSVVNACAAPAFDASRS
jgi:hypothetical protein